MVLSHCAFFSCLFWAIWWAAVGNSHFFYGPTGAPDTTGQFVHTGTLLALATSVLFATCWSWGQWPWIVMARCFFRCFYQIRLHQLKNFPMTGGVLLVPNHMSWLDGFLLLIFSPRPVRMLVYAGNFSNPIVRILGDAWGAILVSSGPKSIRNALATARQSLQDGAVVCIFAEGGISRSAQLQAFRQGILKVIEGTTAVAVPVFLDELWGSIFSFERAKFFWKWPRRWRYPVSIHFGKPIHDLTEVGTVRMAVAELGADAVKERIRKYPLLTRRFIRTCKRRKFVSKVADSSKMDLTGGQCLMRALILRRLLKRNVLGRDEKNVGLLLPPSVVGLLANMALALDRRVAINLNYTVSSETLNQCIAAAGIQHVVTSRQVMSKLDIQLNVPLVYLEDYKPKVKLSDKIICPLAAYTVPSALLDWCLGLGRVQGSDLATIIFTSGSTGKPKGVMLSYDNLASNVEAIEQVIHLVKSDVVIGILPFFHSFGYTVTMWTPMGLDIKSAYHYSPMDGKRIGKLTQDHKGTVLLSTPTFLRSFLRRVTPEQFKTLDVVVAGAEKLHKSLSDSFEERFGTRPVEGYGCTELSPLASVNVPASRSYAVGQIDAKEGTVGRPVPGVAAKTVHIDSGEDLPEGSEGMLWIKGPNVMQGYLDQPELTAQVVRDGWYVTGDLGLVDEDGFIQITGRQSRFSKIGGEMVPHIKIEDILNELIGVDDESGIRAAVSAVPNTKKGERLIVLHVPMTKTPGELRAGLVAAGLPNLFIPSESSFIQVPQLPVLGTGKLDLHGIKEMAVSLAGHLDDE